MQVIEFNSQIERGKIAVPKTSDKKVLESNCF